MTTNDEYHELTTRWGYNDSSRLRQILEYMMTPDQAKMVVALPGTPDEVAEKTGFDLNRVKESLEELFYKGAIVPKGHEFPFVSVTSTLYREPLPQFVTTIFQLAGRPGSLITRSV